jgi:hypothetical protein
VLLFVYPGSSVAVNKDLSCDAAWSHFSGAVMRRVMRFAASQYCVLVTDVSGIGANTVESIVVV